MSEAERALSLAIGRAYKAFADAPFPRRLEASPLRDPKAVLKALASAPLHALGPKQIGPYADWAISTVGTGEDYQHFLPRILDLATREGSWLGFGPPVIAGKLQSADWTRWSGARRGAILGVFDAAFAASLAGPGLCGTPDDWLSGLARLRDVTEALDLWRADLTPRAAIHLASFRVSWVNSLAGEARPPPFWEDVDPGVSAQVEAWLLSAEARRQIERALSLVAEEDRWDLERALPDQ